MKNDKVALFFDIDGTLYDSSILGIRPSTLEILDKLKKDPKYDLYIATGRSMETFRDLMHHFEGFKGFVLSNGQYIVVDNQCIYEGGIPYLEVNTFLDFCDVNHFSVVVLTRTMLYSNYLDEKGYQNFQKYVHAEIEELKGRRFTEKDKIHQIWLFATNEEICNIMPKFTNFTIIPWGKYGADIIPNGASKGLGVQAVIEKLGYDITHTYAFGDGANDVMMFQKVGTSICMGNGAEIAKQNAKYICEPITEEGLAKSIEQYVIKKTHLS